MWHKRYLLVVSSLDVKCPGRKESFKMHQISKTVMKKYCINLNIKPRSIHRNTCDIHVMLPNRLQWCLQLVWHLKCGTCLSRSRVNFAPWRQISLDSPGWGRSTEAATRGCAHPYGEPTGKHGMGTLDLSASEFPGKQVGITSWAPPEGRNYYFQKLFLRTFAVYLCKDQVWYELIW